MWTFLKPLNLIRYLIVLRVNSSLVRMPHYPATECSLVLGSMIANRLPSREAKPWQKSLAAWDEYGGISIVGRKKPKHVPNASWPIETVLFFYPGKRSYSSGELIFWELKLMGECADHGIFLETILPALEETGFASDTPWVSANTLWGHYDIHAVYAARGERWEPIVQEGKLDLQYKPTPHQWASNLELEPSLKFDSLNLEWITPFDLRENLPANRNKYHKRKKPCKNEMPTLQRILNALLERTSQLLPAKHAVSADIWEAIGEDEQFQLTDLLEQASHTSIRNYHFTHPPKEWPERWIGHERLTHVPQAAIPYLQLASILHIGGQTHLGCGTFRVELRG